MHAGGEFELTSRQVLFSMSLLLAPDWGAHSLMSGACATKV
jgi:hypothetical protein